MQLVICGLATVTQLYLCCRACGSRQSHIQYFLNHFVFLFVLQGEKILFIFACTSELKDGEGHRQPLRPTEPLRHVLWGVSFTGLLFLLEPIILIAIQRIYKFELPFYDILVRNNLSKTKSFFAVYGTERFCGNFTRIPSASHRLGESWYQTVSFVQRYWIQILVSSFIWRDSSPHLFLLVHQNPPPFLI